MAAYFHRILPVMAGCMAAALWLPGLSSTLSAAEPDDALKAAREVDRLLAKEVFSQPEFSASDLAPPITDEKYLRRVSLDVKGVIPSPGEVTAFLFDTSEDKRARLVDRLLDDEAFGLNWARYWRDVIMARRTQQRALSASDSLTTYLTNAFNDDKGWDEIAHDFVTATGDIRENGATALIFAQSVNAEDIAAEVSRVFMGIQIQCAQCHDHPTDRWKREQFHELAAFFPRIVSRPVLDKEPRSFVIASRDGAPVGRRRFALTNLEHYMPDLNDPSAQGTLMQPVFFSTGKEFRSGALDLQRRKALADWLVADENEWFATAYVNRMWSELVGEGFYEPVDDIGPDREPEAPETLAYLVDQFRKHDYSTKWLMRAILATEAYARESRPPRTSRQLPFLANRVQPLRADVILDCLGAALEVDVAESPNDDSPDAARARLRSPRRQVINAFNYDPSLHRDEVTSTIPQALLLMNNRSFDRALDADDPGSLLGRLTAETPDDKSMVLELYLRVLARQPRPAEIKTCLDHVRATRDRGAAYEDLLWALVNSTEFRHRD